ncbi:TPA: hypothetical protein ACNOH8_003990 [Klebsiella aerogenes]
MALTLLANNNAKSFLASGISASATVLTVSSGSGALFPAVTSGVNYFKLTIVDAATKNISEIVHVTSVSGDVMTIQRGQEGTVSRVWSTNDIVANMMTAGTLDLMLQTSNNLSEIKSSGSLAMAEARENIGVADSNGYVGRLINVQRLLTSGTYIRSPGATKGYIELIGGGGGGAGARATDAGQLAGGAGGGGGGYCASWIDALPASQAFTIGAGGSPGINTGSPSAGGSTTFGSMTATGGGPGAGTGSLTTPSGTPMQQRGGDPGLGSGGNLVNSYGFAGGNLILTLTGNSIAGHGGGTIKCGGVQGRAGSSGDGINGAYGSGGSGALSDGSPSSAFTGGRGGDGVIWIWEYA